MGPLARKASSFRFLPPWTHRVLCIRRRCRFGLAVLRFIRAAAATIAAVAVPAAIIVVQRRRRRRLGPGRLCGHGYI